MRPRTLSIRSLPQLQNCIHANPVLAPGVNHDMTTTYSRLLSMVVAAGLVLASAPHALAQDRSRGDRDDRQPRAQQRSDAGTQRARDQARQGNADRAERAQAPQQNRQREQAKRQERQREQASRQQERQSAIREQARRAQQPSREASSQRPPQQAVREQQRRD